MVARDEFKEIIRRLKAAVIMRWANEKSTVARELSWSDLHAVGNLEALITSLKVSDTVRRRKAKKGGG